MDDIVAIAPGIGPVIVVFKALALPKTHDIEPMLRPAFPVSRRSEQTIHDFGPSLRRLIGDKGVHLGGGGRQARHVQRRATQ